MYEIITATTMNTRTMTTTYRVVSRHKTKAAAEQKIEQIAKREQKSRWPYRPEMINVIAGEYEIREA